MASKSKTSGSGTLLFKKRVQKKLRRHTKSKTHIKGSKNYSKKYRGQGR